VHVFFQFDIKYWAVNMQRMWSKLAGRHATNLTRIAPELQSANMQYTFTKT